jgi:hypothetical protein
MSVIVEQDGHAYLRAMTATLVRLLALLALAMMPGLMASAPAMASTTATASGHCEEHKDPVSAPDQSPAHCSACAAMPAVDTGSAQIEFTASALPYLPVGRTLAGILLEIATPPPKSA